MDHLAALWTIFRRELAAYFNAAIAYIFIIVFVLLSGGLFMTQFFLMDLADMRSFFGTLPYLLAVFIPAVTMRQWAEEKRGNTLELLLTFPMGTHALVLGKFLAGFVFYLAALAGTLTIPLMLLFLGRPDFGGIIGGYLGAAFLGGFFLAIGIFISGLCRDQIVAFILTMMACFGLHLLGNEFMAASIDGWLPGLGSLLRYFVGVAGHFESFTKGVVDNRDILYFLIGTGIFLVLNGFWFEGRMRPGANKVFITAALISAGIFLMQNWLLAGFPLGRFDMTQGGVHTVSRATKEILSRLKAPVTAKFYVSPADKLPTGMKTLEQDVIDQLNELRIVSKGNFQYKIFHMEAANAMESGMKPGEDSMEAQLERKGIQPFQVQAIDADEVAVKLVYASMALSYKEKPEEIIPRIIPDTLYDLEYTLVSKIYRMTLDKQPEIAMVAPFTESDMDPQMQMLLAQLGGQFPSRMREDDYEVLQMALTYEGYQVSRITLDENQPIPPETDTLVILQPENLNERARYEINRFLAGGGSLFLAVQNYEYDYAPEGGDLAIHPVEKRPNINPLLEGWGFKVSEEILADHQHDVINLSGGARLGPFAISVPVKLPIQIVISADSMNPGVSLTARLSDLFYLWGTALEMDAKKIQSQKLSVKTLFSSSDDSWAVPFSQEPLHAWDLERQSTNPRGPFPLAVLAEGQFPNLYEGRQIPSWPAASLAGDTAEPPQSQEAVSLSLRPGKMILMGAATMFQKRAVTSGGHLDFFMNAVDALTLGEELVTIRSKRPVNRSLGHVSTAAKAGWRVFVTLLVPVVLAVIGTLRMFLRRKAKQDYLKSLVLASP